MNNPIRVLVVDDSSTARALIVGMLESDPRVTVVGEAASGAEAVEAAIRLRPSLITMDIHMPGMDGLEATRQIMTQAPTPIVIVSSAANSTEVDLSLDATAAGALTVVGKMEGPDAPDFDERREEFVGLLKALAQVKVVRRWNRRVTPSDPVPAVRFTPDVRPARVVAIAASTGGPAVLQRIFSALPGDFPLPILVVQHIAHGFVRGLADWLGGSTKLRVRVARDGETLRPGHVYIAPDKRHLGVADFDRMRLDAGPPVNGFRPAGTFLFQSVAKAFGPATAAVILTGMGTDGLEGLRAVRRAGGQIIAQEETSCVVYGMPQAAVRAGIVDAVLPPQRITEYLNALERGGVYAR
jgi:two-component system chemotaxis response regulator CheB